MSKIQNQITPFTVSKAFVRDVVMRQSGSITNAIVELICNACDAGASTVTVTLRPGPADASGKVTHAWLSVKDDGTGLGDRDAALKAFSSLGGSAKKGDNKFGTFGIGRCQILAFSDHTTWRSGRIKVTMHLGESEEDQGVVVEDLLDGEESVHGTEVDVQLSTAATEKFASIALVNALRYLVPYIACRVDVTDCMSDVNAAAVTISNGAPLATRHHWEYSDKLAYYRVVTPGSGNIVTYNMGMKCHSAFSEGATDSDIHVITRAPVTLNVARNQVSDVCEVFRATQRKAEELSRTRVLDVAPCDATTAARSFVGMCALKRGRLFESLTASKISSKLRAMARRTNVAVYVRAGQHRLVTMNGLAKHKGSANSCIPVVVPSWQGRYNYDGAAARRAEMAQQAAATGKAVGLDAEWADAVIDNLRHFSVTLPVNWDRYELEGRMFTLVFLLNLAAGKDLFAIMDIARLCDDDGVSLPSQHALQDTEQHAIAAERLAPKQAAMRQTCVHIVNALSKAWIPNYPTPRVVVFNGSALLYKRRAMTDGAGTIWVSAAYLDKVAASAASPAPFLTLALTLAHELMHILGIQRGFNTLRDGHVDFYRAFHDRVCCAESDGASNLIGLMAYRGFQQYWSSMLEGGETPAPLELKALSANLHKLSRACDLLLANAEGADNGSEHGTDPEKIAGSSLP